MYFPSAFGLSFPHCPSPSFSGWDRLSGKSWESCRAVLLGWEGCFILSFGQQRNSSAQQLSASCENNNSTQHANASPTIVPAAPDTHSSTAFLGRSEGISVTLLSWQRKILWEQWQIRWWHPKPKLRNASKETRNKAILIHPSTCFLPASAEKSLHKFQKLHTAPLWEEICQGHVTDQRIFFFFLVTFRQIAKFLHARSDFHGKISYSLILLYWISSTLTQRRQQIEPLMHVWSSIHLLNYRSVCWSPFSSQESDMIDFLQKRHNMQWETSIRVSLSEGHGPISNLGINLFLQPTWV